MSFLVGVIIVLLGSQKGWLPAIISILLFAVMTGLSPSVIRAAFMQILFLTAPIFRREADGITSVGFALFVILLINPFAVASISLQLSFAAMIGIIVVTPKLLKCFRDTENRLKGIIKRLYVFITYSVATSFGAIVFTTPLCAFYFGNISLLAPITNLLVLWIVPWCFCAGFLLCAVSPFSSFLAGLIGNGISYMVEYIYSVSGWISNIPYASVYLPNRLTAVWLLCVALIIVVLFAVKLQKIYKVVVAVFLSYSILLLLNFGVELYYTDGTTIAAIDVGQGQCIAILNGADTFLIDCGGDYDSGQNVVRWLKEHGRKKVDSVIITHFDTDHVNGIVDVMTQMTVDEIRCCTLNISEYESELLREIQHTADKCQTNLVFHNRTTKVSCGLLDLILFVPQKPSDNNGIMVVGQINEFDILVPGDADMKMEAEFMDYVRIVDGECLVVGHHGSKYSTSEALLEQFQPEYAFISCGFNHYGHPTKEVLDRLEKRNVVIYRTDVLGSIEMKVR